MTRHQKKHWVLQVCRQLTRLTVLALVVTIVYLSLYAHYRAAKAMEDEQFLDGVNGTVLKRIDQHVSEMEEPQAFLDDYKGTLWSMRVAGVDVADPLAAAEMTATSKAIHWPLLLSIVIPVGITVLLGRVFCSWMCPAGLLFEWAQGLRRLLRLAEIKPGNVRFSHHNKYVLLSVGLLMGLIFGLPTFALIYPPAVLSRLTHAVIFGTAFTGMVVVLGVMLAVEVFVSPRWWCRTMCAGGALYALLSWARPVRVKLLRSKCTGCRDCEPVCPMGIYPVAKSNSIECDNCGLCLRHCPDDALVFSIGLPGERGRSRDHKSPTRNKSTLAKTASVLAFTLTMLWSSSANAHHILGLPHYSYKENYPQAPTLEYPATTGPYDLVMTSYPGKPVPGESANVAFYIKDRNTLAPYAQQVKVRLIQTSTFGSNKVLVPPTTVDAFDKTHKISMVFPDEGEYIVELTMDVEGQTEVIPFLVVAGDPTATASVLIVIGVGMVGFIVIVRAIKIKRARRDAQRNGESSSAPPVVA